MVDKTGAVARGEVDGELDPAATASMIVAVLQAGYVVARAAELVEPFKQAVDGVPPPSRRSRPPLGLFVARTTANSE